LRYRLGKVLGHEVPEAASEEADVDVRLLLHPHRLDVLPFDILADRRNERQAGPYHYE
jgi:hypothetical protein